MIAFGSNREAEQARFDATADDCGVAEVEGETWFCSRSCEALGHHFLIFPEPTETFDAALARARAERL